MPGETAFSFDNALLLPEVIKKVKAMAQQVRGKEAELKSIRDQNRSLRGNFDKVIIAQDRAHARIKALEESFDANAEEMLGTRMRARGLERELAEKEKNVQSLVTALDKYRADVKRLEELITAMDEQHMKKLQASCEQLNAQHSQELSDLDAKAAAEERGRRAAEESAVSRLDQIQELEHALRAAETQVITANTTIKSLEIQLRSLGTQRDEEVGGLNTRISNLATALASANADIDKLKISNAKLEAWVQLEVKQGTRTVEDITAKILRSVASMSENKKDYLRGTKIRCANYEIESENGSEGSITGPMTPSSVRWADDVETPRQDSNRGVEREDDVDDEDHVEGRVQISRGRTPKRHLYRGLGIMKKSPGQHRRRYDSGIDMQFLGDEDSDMEAAGNGDVLGVMTPDLSSDI